MRTQKNDNNSFEFNIGLGLGDISFNMTEERLYQKLGKPESVDVDIYEKDIEETKRYHYPDRGLMISISMYESINEPLKIYPQKLLINGSNLYDFKLNDLIKFIKLLHNQNNIEYIVELSEESFENVYNYPNLGLMVWFEGEYLIDVCLEKPDLN